MRCPFCFFEDTKVVDSRLQSSGDQVRRRRECLECNTRFTTYESAYLSLPRVVKNDGRRESFYDDKLRASFQKALEKRSIDTSKIEEQIEKIKILLRQGGEKEGILLGVLGAEQSFFAPEEAIGGVFIAPHIEQSRRHQTGLSDIPTGGCNGFVLAGFQVMGGHMGEHSLTRQTTAADALTLFGHGLAPVKN